MRFKRSLCEPDGAQMASLDMHAEHGTCNDHSAAYREPTTDAPAAATAC